jgi:hypothetical protein
MLRSKRRIAKRKKGMLSLLKEYNSSYELALLHQRPIVHKTESTARTINATNTIVI